MHSLQFSCGQKEAQELLMSNVTPAAIPCLSNDLIGYKSAAQAISTKLYSYEKMTCCKVQQSRVRIV